MPMKASLAILSFLLFFFTPIAHSDSESTGEPFTVVSCPFTIPPGEHAVCGYLTVPENRENPNTRTIKLFITIMKSLSQTPKSDPIVFLTGGPGLGASSRVKKIAFWNGLRPFRLERDIILVDQRGTGLSIPRLDCKNISMNLTDIPTIFALTQCKNRLLKQNIDLSAYNTRENAADIIALMNILKINSWNIIGNSYGSRLGLAILAAKPLGLRSATFSAIMPLTSTWYLTVKAENDKNVFTQVFEDCAADAECASRFPHLKEHYLSLMNELSKMDNQKLSANEVINVLANKLAYGEATYVPYYIEKLYTMRLHQKLNRESFASLFSPSKNTIAPDHQLGMNFSVMCNDQYNLLSEKDIADQIEKANIYFPYYPSYSSSTTSASSSLCKIWGGDNVLARLQKDFKSEVPTLLFRGKYDTDLAYTWFEDVAHSLDHAYAFIFDGVGHDVFGSLPCARDVTINFLDNPLQNPHPACLGDLKPPVFYTEELTEKLRPNTTIH